MDVQRKEASTNGQPSKESDEGLQLSLLENQSLPPTKPPKTPAQRAVRKAFKGSAYLSNLLPTGSVLVFKILSPVFTHQGTCKTYVSQTTTLGLLGLCATMCLVLSFTDSFRDKRGKVRHGLATFRGLWVIDGPACAVPPEEAQKFRLRLVDFFHALMSLMAFASLAMFDKNVINCFYPSPSEEVLEILEVLPGSVAVLCGMLFVLFPSRRHGIGFPLSSR